MSRFYEYGCYRAECVRWCRFGGARKPHEGSPGGPDGKMFQGEDDVCHESVMIEMPLNRKQMSLVSAPLAIHSLQVVLTLESVSQVQHMETMDQPWNCPHGRSTMRHLVDIATVIRTRHVRKVDWSLPFRG